MSTQTEPTRLTLDLTKAPAFRPPLSFADEGGFYYYLDMFQDDLHMDERHRVMEDGEWIRWARRVTGIPELFVYRHSEQGTFVLAAWRVKSLRIAVELTVLQGPPDRNGWLGERVLQLTVMPHDQKMQKRRQAAEDARYERIEAARESNDEKHDAMKWARRQGKEESARNLAISRFTGQREGGDTLERTKESLKDMMSGKTYHA